MNSEKLRAVNHHSSSRVTVLLLALTIHSSLFTLHCFIDPLARVGRGVRNGFQIETTRVSAAHQDREVVAVAERRADTNLKLVCVFAELDAANPLPELLFAAVPEYTIPNPARNTVLGLI